VAKGLLGAVGRQQRGGVRENRPTCGGLEEGGHGSHRRGQPGRRGTAGSGVAVARACPHSGGRCRVADGRGLDGSGIARGARRPAVSG
jgi:hypothetical protein